MWEGFACVCCVVCCVVCGVLCVCCSPNLSPLVVYQARGTNNSTWSGDKRRKGRTDGRRIRCGICFAVSLVPRRSLADVRARQWMHQPLLLARQRILTPRTPP